MGHDPHVRACPLGLGSACSTGPPECICQTPCVRRACSLERGFRASFRSFLEPDATPERSRGLVLADGGSLLPGHPLCAGCGGQGGAKCSSCPCGGKLRVCAPYASMCNRQGGGRAGRRGVPASWEEVPPHLEFGETVAGRARGPSPPSPLWREGMLTDSPRTPGTWIFGKTAGSREPSMVWSSLTCRPERPDLAHRLCRGRPSTES